MDLTNFDYCLCAVIAVLVILILNNRKEKYVYPLGGFTSDRKLYCADGHCSTIRDQDLFGP